jgi:hypothetical protein
MQGIESLNNFKNFVSSIGGLGRYEDTYIVHAAEGETVVPMEVFNRNPVLKERLFESMRDMGIEPERYVVGNELNSINPVTGQPEFFLKNIGKFINRVMPGDSEKYLPIAAGFFPGLSTLAAAGVGAGIGAASAAGRDENILSGALTGGLMGGGTRSLLGRYGESLGLPGKFSFDARKDAGLNTLGLDFQEKLMSDLGALNPFKSKEPETITQKVTKVQDNYLAETGKTLDFDDALEVVKVTGGTKTKGTGGLGTLGGLTLGLGATGILGSVIGEPKSAKVDRSEIYEPEITNEFAFNPNMQFTRPEIVSPIVKPDFSPTLAAEGGVMDLRQGGESEGPGTGTSDDIPAMLSDGEFVMTAKAVRGAGGGDRREGAKKMYEMMDNLEARG